MRWEALVLAAALAACAGPSTQQATSGVGKIDGAYLTTGGTGSDWAATGYNYQEQRYSPLTQVNAGNVGQLGLAWSADLPDARGQEATPIVIDGKLFVTGPWSKVFAYDAVTGKPLWTYDPGVDKAKGVEACCDVVNRGVAAWKGRLYLGTLDGRLDRTRCRHGEARLVGADHRQQQALHDHRRTAGRQGHGPDRQRRCRVRRARLCHRL